MHIEPGRPYRLAVDATDGNYLISEQVEYELRLLSEALRSAAILCESFDLHASDFELHQAAALFHVFGERAADLLACATFRPASGGASS